MSPIPRSSCDEETPLLKPLRRTNSRTHSLIHQAHSPRIIITLITAIVFIISFGGYLVLVPSLRIYEDILCHRFYERSQDIAHFGLNSRIDEKWCKGDEVQEELNILTAGLDTLRSVPGKAPHLGGEQDDVESIRLTFLAGMFMAVPYGLLADKLDAELTFIKNWPKTSVCTGHYWTTPISLI
ncbi:major facilitator superfamily transporter protein [Rutstroemia sp. NJR-2017a BBW]|nr:major facilitator superfamily transporter protein [Rutstroemia sp. NJR-2017a BBW]